MFLSLILSLLSSVSVYAQDQKPAENKEPTAANIAVALFKDVPVFELINPMTLATIPPTTLATINIQGLAGQQAPPVLFFSTVPTKDSIAVRLLEFNKAEAPKKMETAKEGEVKKTELETAKEGEVKKAKGEHKPSSSSQGKKKAGMKAIKEGQIEMENDNANENDREKNEMENEIEDD